MTDAFSIKEALRFGWHKTREHSGLIFKIIVSLAALQVLSALINKVLEYSLLYIPASIALGFVSIIVGAGTTVIILKLAKGEHTHYRDLAPHPRLVWHFVVVSAVVGALTFVGFVLLVIPGIYLMLRFSMARFAVVDGGGIMQSIRQSGHMTKGVKWHLLVFFLAVLAINIIGAMLFLVGLLVTVPVTMIAYAHIYQKLKNRA